MNLNYIKNIFLIKNKQETVIKGEVRYKTTDFKEYYFPSSVMNIYFSFQLMLKYHSQENNFWLVIWMGLHKMIILKGIITFVINSFT